MSKKIVMILCLISMIALVGCSSAPQAEQVQTPQPEPVVEEQAAPAEAVEEQVQAPVEEVPPAPGTTADHQVIILGKAGFEPLELTINAGDSVAWINQHEKDVTLTIFNGRKFLENSPVIKPEEAYEFVFEEAGEYPYWTIGYGPVDAKVIVQ